MNNGKGMLNGQRLKMDVTDITSFCEMVNSHIEVTLSEERNLNSKLITTEESYTIYEETLAIPKIIITIPAYNEEKTIGKVIWEIREIMDQTKFCYNYLILVVNDGSNDTTDDVATHAGAFVYSHKTNKGLAQTFRTEMKLCLELGADIIVHTDADGQYKAEEIPLLIQEVENGFDLVLGSRFSGTIEEMPLLKRFGNIAFSTVISVLTRKRITDGQTGFRAFTKDIAREIPIISTHTYTQEQIIRASKQRYSIKEISIYFGKRSDGVSRLMRSPFEYAIRAWKNILKIYFSKN